MPYLKPNKTKPDFKNEIFVCYTPKKYQMCVTGGQDTPIS